MKTELQHVMQDIIGSKTPLKWLELSDAYIELYNKSKDSFILPSAHAHLSVVVEEFAEDPIGFRNFVRSVRDSVDREDKIAVHTFYRKVNTRVTQKVKRDRKWLAINLIESHLGIKFTSGQKESVYTWLTQYWAKQRVDFLDLHRRAEPEKKLTSDQRTDLSEEFWDKIDAELSNNIFPVPPEVVYAKLASLESYKSDSV